MKKGNLFLTGLTLLTVVGGALALKAKVPLTLYTCNIAESVCNMPTTTYTTWKTTITNAQGITFPAGKLNDPCTIINGVRTCTTKITCCIEEG